MQSLARHLLQVSQSQLGESQCGADRVSDAVQHGHASIIAASWSVGDYLLGRVSNG